MKINYKIVKKFSNKEISVRENIKLYRTFQKILFPINNDAKYEDIEISLDHRNVKVRVFNDFKDNTNHKIIVFLHGGGWAAGCLPSYTSFCNKLSKETNRIVLLVEYRLAPENPYPAGFDDCYEIVYLIMKNAKKLKIKQKDICLMGDSAGGNLVAAISHKARDTRNFKVHKSILLYPTLQTDYSLKTPYPSVIKNGYDYMLTRKNLKDFVHMYIKQEDDLYNPYCAPLMDTNFKKLPETLIVTCELDPLRDEGREYAKRLIKSKNKVTHLEYNTMHGYMRNKMYKDEIESTFNEIRLFLGDENE